MYGNWTALSFGGVVFAILLLLILVVTPWTAVFAIAIAAVAGVALAITMSVRRQRSAPDEQSSSRARDPSDAARQPANPRSGGRPVSGEG